MQPRMDLNFCLPTSSVLGIKSAASCILGKRSYRLSCTSPAVIPETVGSSYRPGREGWGGMPG